LFDDVVGAPGPHLVFLLGGGGSRVSRRGFAFVF
jgi:hypothetical protein